VVTLRAARLKGGLRAVQTETRKKKSLTNTSRRPLGEVLRMVGAASPA
jgi:hypothetical protein